VLALGSLAFASPWLLGALAALPIIWWLLRVTPPAARRIPFPAIRLLLGFLPRDETPARTPLWLILLRMALTALVIVAVARPLINPQARLAGTGPIVLIVDNGWAAAADWQARRTALDGFLAEAEREGRQVILAATAPAAGYAATPPLAPVRAADAAAAVRALQPQPWPDNRPGLLARLDKLTLPPDVLSVWLSDGVAGRGSARLADWLASRGPLRYLAAGPDATPLLLAPDNPAGRELAVVLRAIPAPVPRRYEVRASGEDGRLLTRQPAVLAAGKSAVAVRLPMPVELRNEVTSIAVEGVQSAGAVLLADERWRRRPVGIAVASGPAGEPLLSQSYYLEKALAPFAEIRRGPVGDLLRRRLAVLILPDYEPDSAVVATAIGKWVEGGGLLLCFAGPHLAAEQGDSLLPVRLRRGGRTIGGALSWERPAGLAPFAADSPFAGLVVPKDVTVSRQVLAEPDLELAARTWARLADGTPLVTAAKRGRGWIVLVHTTANADWSNLALSGLFVEMLRRIVAMSQGVAADDEGELTPLETLDGFGQLRHAPAIARAVSAKEIATARASPVHPPGFYGKADARRALNLATGISLQPIEGLPSGVRPETFGKSREIDLRPPLLLAALLLALADLVIAFAMRGLLRRRPTRQVAGLLFAALCLPATAHADDAFAVRATSKFHLAYIRTGYQSVDAISRAGLVGLSDALERRTAVDPGNPIAVDIEADDLIFFPLLYWPATAEEPPPSPQAVGRINHYLDTGGTILYDTRDGDEGETGAFGGAAIAGEELRRLTAGIKIPPLVPIPANHVLTKSFYLLHEFPGRWNVGTLWVEPADDHINDGVSSVIVGANDWAAAWAVDDQDRPLFVPVPGGEAQREMGLRFGINLVMYVLTGNYKADQVHVPAILERLGQ
jgi:Domain of unknown function (DUF4159)/Aerotolerance regulator N-terminal